MVEMIIGVHLIYRLDFLQFPDHCLTVMSIPDDGIAHFLCFFDRHLVQAGHLEKWNDVTRRERHIWLSIGKGETGNRHQELLMSQWFIRWLPHAFNFSQPVHFCFDNIWVRVFELPFLAINPKQLCNLINEKPIHCLPGIAQWIRGLSLDIQAALLS